MAGTNIKALALFRKSRGEHKAPSLPPRPTYHPTSFSPVTSTNVRINVRVATLLTDWCKISSLYLVPTVPNYWAWTKTTPQKKRFFWSNHFKNWGYDNFSCTYARVTKLCSHDHIHNIVWVIWQNFAGDAKDRIYDEINFVPPSVSSPEKAHPE